MLGQNADKSLHAAERRTVYHNGAVFGIVFASVGKLKAFRQIVVYLDGA